MLIKIKARLRIPERLGKKREDIRLKNLLK
jgi:hypothetical protein